MSSPVNPYQPSAHASEPIRATPAAKASPGPHYQSRLDWSDRQALLKSLGPIRLSTVLGGLYWLKSVFFYGTFLADALWRREHIDRPTFAVVALAAFWLCQGILHLYVYRLNWSYADTLQELAGGRTASYGEWTRLHYRTWWLSAACWILAMATEAGNWLVRRWAMAAVLGP